MHTKGEKMNAINIKTINGNKNPLALFEDLFKQFFLPLTNYAYRYVNNKQIAEDITQDVFMALWMKKEEIDFTKPIEPYLYRAIYNKSINHLSSSFVQRRIDQMDSIDDLINWEVLDYNQYDLLLLKEISKEIDVYVSGLSSQCQKVYRLSRESNMKNKEIALLLNISEKAVEKHISKALHGIREHLIKMDLMTMLCYLLANIPA